MRGLNEVLLLFPLADSNLFQHLFSTLPLPFLMAALHTHGTNHSHGSHGPSSATHAVVKDFHELVSECEDVIRSFDPLKTTVDSHAEEKLGKITEATDADTIFVQQVFYGCVRYQRALKVFLSSFYFKNSGTTLRTDYT